jgi:hypothetical protein
MKALYFLRFPLLIFLIGYLIRFIGALFKIRYWPSADELITMGTLIAGLGIVFGIIKIILMKKTE